MLGKKYFLRPLFQNNFSKMTQTIWIKNLSEHKGCKKLLRIEKFIFTQFFLSKSSKSFWEILKMLTSIFQNIDFFESEKEESSIYKTGNIVEWRIKQWLEPRKQNSMLSSFIKSPVESLWVVNNNNNNNSNSFRFLFAALRVDLLSASLYFLSCLPIMCHVWALNFEFFNF